MPRLLAALLLLPLAAAAQWPAPGTRVRVRLPAPQPTVAGQVIRLAPDTMVLQVGVEAPRAIPLATVMTIETSRGYRNATWRGTAVGFFTGALVGGLIGYVGPWGGDCGGVPLPCIERGTGTVVGFALIGGVAGGVLGLLVGSATWSEHWLAVPLPAGAGTRDAPRR